MTQLPRYDELPEAPEGGRSGWGLFGSDDNLGLVNLLTPERVLEAARLVKRGRVFPMNAPLDAVSPPISSARGMPRHHLVHADGALSFDDVYDNFFPQGSSQWDSLGHIGYATNTFYNGATEADIASGRRNTMDHWARHGIAGRAVILDLVGTLGNSYDPGTSTAFAVDDLERARRDANLEYRGGDIIVLHTGFLGWYRDQGEAVRAKVARTMSTPGLASGEEMCRYLWDIHVAGIVADTYGVEVTPPDFSSPTSFLHRMLIGQFGMALGELWWTEDLVADCTEDGVYEGLLVSAPMNGSGAIGSPANALVIK